MVIKDFTGLWIYSFTFVTIPVSPWQHIMADFHRQDIFYGCL